VQVRETDMSAAGRPVVVSRTWQVIWSLDDMVDGGSRCDDKTWSLFAGAVICHC
jgi:hypothetical protein